MADTTQLRAVLMGPAFGYMASQVTYVGASLGLADLLAEGPATVDSLATATETDRGGLFRLLRALVCLGLFEDQGSGTFGLTEMGALLRSDHPSSARNIIQLFCGDLVWKNWGALEESVRTGRPGWELRDEPSPFEVFASDPEFSAIFNEAMSEGTRQMAPGVVATYDFTQFSTIADLGGGDGTLLSAILAAAPEARGILFDLPAGNARAAARLAAAGVADRCEVVDGDFFESVPEGLDAYVIKSVLHDWDDERCVAILRNVRKAMADSGKVVVLEPVVPERITASPDAYGAILVGDMNMLVSTGGRERTEAEFADLLAAADLQLTRVVPIVPGRGYMSVIEAIPAPA